MADTATRKAALVARLASQDYVTVLYRTLAGKVGSKTLTRRKAPPHEGQATRWETHDHLLGGFEPRMGRYITLIVDNILDKEL